MAYQPITTQPVKTSGYVPITAKTGPGSYIPITAAPVIAPTPSLSSLVIPRLVDLPKPDPVEVSKYIGQSTPFTGTINSESPAAFFMTGVSDFATKIKTGLGNVANSAWNSYSNFLSEPDYKNVSSKPIVATLQNLPPSIAENLPFGVGEIVKQAKADPTLISNLTAHDVLNGLPEAGKNIVKGLVADPILTLAGGVLFPVMHLLDNNNWGEISFNIPGLGEVSNSQARAAQDVQSGENPYVAALKEAPNAIFSTLMVLGMADKFFSPRETTIAKGNTPEGVAVKEGPQTGRVYQPPTNIQAVPPEILNKVMDQGVTLKNYDPKAPTYFKMEGTNQGNVTGSLVQIKPSYFQTFVDKFGGDISKAPSTELVPLYSQDVSLEAIKNGVAGAYKQFQEIPNKQGGFIKNPLTSSPQESNSKIPNDLQPLAEEAKKYKSAEEFVNAQPIIYRGGAKLNSSLVTDQGISFSKSKDVAQKFANEKTGNTLQEAVIYPDAKIIKIQDIPKEFANDFDAAPWAKKNGYDAVDFNGAGFADEIRVINPDVIQTKSQLTDFYNKAVGENSKPASSNIARDTYYTDVVAPQIGKGKTIYMSGDEMKDHFGRDYDPERSDLYAKANFENVQKLLSDPKIKDITFVAGGPGSGKTEFLGKHIQNSNQTDLIYETSFSNPEGLRKLINLARENGKDVAVYGIVTNRENARSFADARAKRTGRTVSEVAFDAGHDGFINANKILLEDGTLSPEDVHLFDFRNITDATTVKKIITQDLYVKDPLALINKASYNIDNAKQGTAKATNTGSAANSGSVKISESVPPSERGSKGQSNDGTGAKRILQPSKVVPSPTVNNQAKDYYFPDKPPFKTGEGRGSSKQIDVAKLSPEKKASLNKTNKKLDNKLEELLTDRDIHKEALDHNPAKALAKYADTNGNLPQVTGNPKGNDFEKRGDDIVTELGFSDSESARAAYENYKKQKDRLTEYNKKITDVRKKIAETNSVDRDVNSINSFLERSGKRIDQTNSKMQQQLENPETEPQRAERMKIGKERMLAIIEKMYKQTFPIERETPQFLLQLTEEAYNLSQEEFEKISAGDPTKMIHLDTNTPLKEKVNIIDYLRTPERVLQKMGLGGIAKMLRQGSERAALELPYHIDLISHWKERADAISPESNRQIFKYLDGQKTIQQNFNGKWVPLLPKEMVIAKEIRAYFSEWADRLGLPADSKISHYITHIFGLGEMEKEFDEDVAKLITDKVPGSVYDPFLLKRLGKKGYKEDTFAALDAYVKRAVRKANMDPALKELKEAAKKLPVESEKYVTRYAGQINMRPTELDTLADNWIKSIVGYKFGQRPVAVITRFLRQLVYRSVLGLNFHSAIKNLTQGVNTFAKLGPKYTAQGYTKLLTQIGSNELQEAGVLKQDIIQDKTLSAVHKGIQKMDKGLFYMFETAEYINRGAAYFGAKQKALDEGMPEDKAIEYAKKTVRDTQFSYGAIDTPVAMGNDISKLFTQFMSFTVKQSEFMAEMVKDKNWAGILRYILASVFLVYTVGEVFDLKGKDFIPGSSLIPGQGFGQDSRFGSIPSLALPKSIVSAIAAAPGSFDPTKGPKGGKSGLDKTIIDIAKNIPIPASLEAQKLWKWFHPAATKKTGTLGTAKLPKLPTFKNSLPKLPKFK